MAINNATLDVGPIVDVNNIGNVDGTAFVFPKSPATQLITDPPTIEGQLLSVQRDSSTTILYVSIETSQGVFEWKRAQPIVSVIDSTTGREWDPRANFIYSYAR